ncbi:phosphotransferase [Xinfangfangia sp. D13-10-4-6]|uniref:phosphotransferase enzyme family protein n=1 Tax=Pseudogemmobacter hezensis TaxID=2737662 RepID=UPI001556E394|nr:phosphotransferase [Pseudogemmobacter hezensis]NPD14200.1 phosphotransferase [Pseudogemmobacter hezensis]
MAGTVLGTNPDTDLRAGSLEEELRLVGQLVEASLPLWPLPAGAEARLLNIAENLTWLIRAGAFRAVLRVHRPGYHSRRGIGQELAWSQALAREAGIDTPAPIAGVNGELVQEGSVPGLGPRHMVLFEFAPGRQPDEDEDLVAPFHTLGAIAARTHLHAQGWAAGEDLERLVWDEDAVFGAGATWGDWRDAPNVTPEICVVLEAVEALLRQRLALWGKGRARYGLIHGDMRLANLLISEGRTVLIDFDDSGLGWYLYDFAAAISFMEDHPQVPALRAAWTEGYRGVAPLSDEEEREIDTFVMLRRMALLAWIGSHIEAPEPRAMAPHFAEGTARLGRIWLAGGSVTGLPAPGLTSDPLAAPGG